MCGYVSSRPPDIDGYAREKVSKSRGIARARPPMGWPQRGCTSRRRSTCRSGGPWAGGQAGQRQSGTAGRAWVWKGGQIGRGSVRRGGRGPVGRLSSCAPTPASRRAAAGVGRGRGPAGRERAGSRAGRQAGAPGAGGHSSARLQPPGARAGHRARGVRFFVRAKSSPRPHATTTSDQLLLCYRLGAQIACSRSWSRRTRKRTPPARTRSASLPEQRGCVGRARLPSARAFAFCSRGNPAGYGRRPQQQLTLLL